jgi:hypothetical protein
MALPADGIIRAASRWLDLLERSSIAQSWVFIHTDSGYSDLSDTQYALALDWLKSIGVLEPRADGLRLASAGRGLTPLQLRELVFARGLEEANPAWLSDSDTLIQDENDLPQDGAAFAGELGINDRTALLGILQVQGKIDLDKRALIGATGEQQLIELLERSWPGSTTYVALDHDGYGYDVALSIERVTWHLEIKTTPRRGRLTIYLSRHEYEVSLLDPNWQLVVVGLNSDGTLGCTATAKWEQLQVRAPADGVSGTRWASARYEIDRTQLSAGLGFLDESAFNGINQPLLVCGSDDESHGFDWMPQ